MLNNWVSAILLPGIGKPYIDIKESPNVVSRLFPSYIKPNKLKWHMDDEDRLVEPLHGNDWFFQMEDQLPVPLNKPIFIKKHTWHRLIKGTGSLTVKITKHAKRA